MSQKFDVSRRESIWKIATGAFAAIGTWSSRILPGAAAGLIAPEISPYAKSVVNEKVVASLGPCTEVKDMFGDLFLGTREQVALIPAQSNPTVIHDADLLLSDPFETFTHTTLEAARNFAGVLDQVESRIKRIDQLVAVNGEGNLVTFGSPTSNELARVALGYTRIDDSDMGLEYIPSTALPLPFSYELDGRAIAKSDSVHRFCYRTVSGRGIEIPNWGIRKSNGALLLPETHDGALLQDYLLISNLPNVFHKTSYEAGRRLINIGGTHREGTSAIQHLFTNKCILEELCGKIKQVKGEKSLVPYWQALILVDCNASDKSVKLNHVIDFKVVDVHTRALEDLVYKNNKQLQEHKTS
jgi:hypothetical protein